MLGDRERREWINGYRKERVATYLKIYDLYFHNLFKIEKITILSNKKGGFYDDSESWRKGSRHAA